MCSVSHRSNGVWDLHSRHPHRGAGWIGMVGLWQGAMLAGSQMLRLRGSNQLRWKGRKMMPTSHNDEIIDVHCVGLVYYFMGLDMVGRGVSRGGC